MPGRRSVSSNSSRPAPSTIIIRMERSRIAELLQPFLSAPLEDSQLESISTYIDILLRWNARINLTSVRHPHEVITRHFGESLFAARHLFPAAAQSSAQPVHLIDFGSGAGFPGLPIKIWRSDLHLTLIESNQRKATFLRETVRSLALADVTVYGGRAESYPGNPAQLITLRAVERFEEALSEATRLIVPGGRIALLIGQAQCARVREIQPRYLWHEPIEIPLSARRVLMIGT
jgi:16S rRNA (guanine527-N7)-methyltransferase